eukprot:4804139-Pleurochrysis_carterae.AAC.1
MAHLRVYSNSSGAEKRKMGQLLGMRQHEELKRVGEEAKCAAIAQARASTQNKAVKKRRECS